MTRKTIGLDREAYDLLRREKEEEESFSDVIKRLARKRRSFLDFAGAWKDVPKEDLDRIREFLQKNRKIGRSEPPTDSGESASLEPEARNGR